MQQCNIKLRETEQMITLYRQHASEDFEVMNGNLIGEHSSCIRSIHIAANLTQLFDHTQCLPRLSSWSIRL